MAMPLDEYLDYIARLYPGKFGQSVYGLLNAPGESPQGTPVAPGQPAPAMPPTINIPPGGPPQAAPGQPPAMGEPAPIASGTSTPAPAAAPGGGNPILDLAKQLMGEAGKTKGLPFPDFKLAPFTGAPERPLPFTLPRFGGV